jgi:DNA-binding GntR family transcriptional regulator
MAEISHRRLVDQTYELIKRRIIDGEIKQGSRIEIKSLALEFKVSENPVRSAVTRLVGDGLVHVIPRRGYFAIQLDEKQLEEIHDVRLLLELYAIEKCVANKRGTEGFQEMYEILKKRSTGSKERYRIRESVELDRQLHLQIINNCNNSKVQKLFLEICDLIELCQAIRDQNEQQVYQEHLAILEAVLAGDEEEAKKRLIIHIENAKARNTESLRATRQASLK